jgi:hypothetical protein
MQGTPLMVRKTVGTIPKIKNATLTEIMNGLQNITKINYPKLWYIYTFAHIWTKLYTSL